MIQCPLCREMCHADEIGYVSTEASNSEVEELKIEVMLCWTVLVCPHWWDVVCMCMCVCVHVCMWSHSTSTTGQAGWLQYR